MRINFIYKKSLFNIEVIYAKWVLNISSFVGLTLAKIAVLFYGNGNSSNVFHRLSLLHRWSSSPICKKGVGKHYLNRTSLIQEYFLYLFCRWMEFLTLYHRKSFNHYFTWLQSIILQQLSSSLFSASQLFYLHQVLLILQLL